MEEEQWVEGTAPAEANVPLEEVSGEIVRVTRSSVGTVRGEEVQISQSAARTIRTDRAELRSSAVVRLDAGEVEMGESCAGLVRGETVRVDESQVWAVTGQDLTMRECNSWAVVGGVVRVEGGKPVVVIGRHIDGAVQPVLDLRGAALFGILAGVSGALILILRGLLRRRRR